MKVATSVKSTVGMVASATYGLMPRVFRLFRARHPGVALSVGVLSTGAQVAALRAGQLQLGIARPPFGDETLAAETLHEEPVMVAIPRGHPLAARRSLPLRALAREPFVLFPRARPGWHDFVHGVCRDAGFQPVVGQEAPELATALALVAAGIGITLVPASVQDLRAAASPTGPSPRPRPGRSSSPSAPRERRCRWSPASSPSCATSWAAASRLLKKAP